ncbi:MAG: ribonuclease HII [Acidobacteria bacterium]|nr:ribonuclease HII [Acidobacteriota bacterium]
MRRWGFYRVAGCDEVGRGCLAGPVVAAAVVLDAGRPIPGVRDSKLVPPDERERLYDVIVRRAVAWSVASASVDEVDDINIHQASLQAMRRSVLALAPLPDLVLVDAFRIPDLQIAQRGVIHGDRRCSAIAAASILAKVTRDREMVAHHLVDPRYGYDRHKGYATALHLAAVAQHGYSALHRKSFRPPSLFDTIATIDS